MLYRSGRAEGPWHVVVLLLGRLELFLSIGSRDNLIICLIRPRTSQEREFGGFSTTLHVLN